MADGIGKIFAEASQYVDLSKPTFWFSAFLIAFNPTFWNLAARSEYHNQTISGAFRDSKKAGCYALASVIFALGIVRDLVYERALNDQPAHPLLAAPEVTYIATALVMCGNTLVLSSMWKLGVTGTYLGDYFGILMDEPVTSFPFNVTGAPMYYGSAMSFLGTALWFGKPAGFLLTLEVWVMYQFALSLEDPFTGEIYAKRDRERQASKQEKSK